ncbi:hypothetical protein [Domibacillus mangrovi]|uniref:Flagellar hook-length control protein-like C-terminal domain-containing protein n=1 Tax=Domibacillus mangrovi TaxID=1714354 RepID=A0A1Q5P4G6_9BACI|nr:hypothetical protein [Domibacillus mangrovi]OKL37155.1 hypothetical protein BLL40_06110 [Domibacillus mangrovi]
MEVGQSEIQRGVRVQLRHNPIEMLNEGQVFAGKVMKRLPGQMAELAAFGQKITAQLEVPLQEGRRYFFQVASLKGTMQLKVLSDHVPMQRTPDQAAALLERLQIPITKESVVFTALAMETGQPLSKDSIQFVSAWLSKAGLKDGMEALRFMFTRHLPITENVFQALVSARTTESLTGKLVALQHALVKLGKVPEATNALNRLLGEPSSSGKTAASPLLNAKAVYLAAALSTGSLSEKVSVVQMLKQALNMPTSSGDVPEQLASIVKNNLTTNKSPVSIVAANIGEQPVAVKNSETTNNPSVQSVQMMKEMLVQLAGKPVTMETITSFKKAVFQSVPANHPDRAAFMQQVTKLTDQLTKGVPAANRQVASLFQLASSVAVTVPEQAAVRLGLLLGTDAWLFEEQQVPAHVSGKDVAIALRDAFQLLGIDHEAIMTSKNQPEAMQQNVKQELLKLMTETIPAPIREAAEQIVGRLNAQHILSVESGPIQQLVMQVPLQFAAFQGDVTIKWSGKKKSNGKIDADYCRVLFYVDMPNLKNTVIDMQVQNRIIHLNIVADAAPSSLKQMSINTMDRLKEALEEHGYRLSGVQFKQPSEEVSYSRGMKQPLAHVMDDEEYLGVDIRI